MADYLDVMSPESRKATDEAINRDKLEIVDNKIQDICDTMESVSDRARVVNHGQDPAQGIEARVVNGTHLIFRNVIYTITEHFVCLGTENIFLSIASKFNDADRSSSHYYTFVSWRVLRYSHSDEVETSGHGVALSARSLCELLHCA